MVPRRVLAALLGYLPTWIVLAASGAAVWLFIDWFRPGVAMTAAVLALALVLLAIWPPLALRDPELAGRLVRPPGELGEAAAARVARLERDLGALGAGQALEQLQLLRQKLEQLAAVLRHRLDEGEVTYGRYLGTAEQVYLAALDNLHEVVVALTAQSGADEAYIERRIAEIERDGVSERERAEFAALQQRHALLLGQREKVDRLMVENERALTVLDNASAALAGTRTRTGHAALPADEAIRELESLASRAGRYASGQ